MRANRKIAADCDSQATMLFHPGHFRPSSVVLGRRPPGRYQLEAASFHVSVNLSNVLFAQKAGPTRHALFFSAGHGPREEILRSCSRFGEAAQIGRQFIRCCSFPVPSVAICVVDLLTPEYIFSYLLAPALAKNL